MTSRCSGDSRCKDWRKASARFFFCRVTSGSSPVSGTVDTVASSNSASVRRRRAESALKRAIASSHVETDERDSKEAACRHTSRNTSLRRSSAKAPSSTRRSSHRYSATRYRAKSARIADWSPAAIRLMSALSEELSRAAAHSSDAAAASPRMQTVAIGDIPYIPASPTTHRQPKMKLQSHCPSLGCEVADGVLGEVFACWLAVTWCRSLDGPPAPPHPLAVLSWGWASHEPLCHSKRVLAASCALPHAG